MARENMTDAGARTIVCVFEDRRDAEAAIRDLKDAGLTDREIGVAMRGPGGAKDAAESAGAGVAAGAATGALSGGIVGGLIGLLGSLLIPGIGPVVAGGVLASTLLGAGAGAATGGIIGALIGMGVSEEDARHFDTRFREGRVLVTVNAGNRPVEVIRILRDHDADLGPSRADLRQAPVAERSLGATPAMAENGVAGAAREAQAAAGGVRSSYTGTDRRYHDDASYTGPERRMVEV